MIRAKRELRVYDGDPCRKCGQTERYVQSKQCRPCSKARAIERQRAVPADHKRKLQRRNNLKRYNLTVEQFEELFLAQGSACAICRTTAPNHVHPWHVDHCHRTGMVRGILCGHCNSGLGYFRDCGGNLRAAIAYLDRTAAPLMAIPPSDWMLFA